MTSERVLTPGGWRHRALVHRVEKGQSVHMADDRPKLMNLASRALIDLPAFTTQPGDVPGFGTGWITYAAWTNNTGTPVSSFRTTFKVPPAPKTSSGQTIFLFPGIDPADASKAILQPVLQWGVSHAGGGAYWSVASWYVLGSGQAFFTPLVNVNIGDTLVGVMKLTGQAGGKFSYSCGFDGIAGTSLPVQNVDELVWCNETLEAYGITACSDYPETNFTGMASINLLTGSVAPTVTWTPQSPVTDCGQHTLVPVDGATHAEVDLYYRDPRIDLGVLAKLAEVSRILFGVTNDGGGIVVLPNGQIIRVPPRSPLGPLFQQIAAGVAEVGRGFAVREPMQGTSLKDHGDAINKASLDLMARGLEAALMAVKKEPL
jgi:hypothetical protein